MLTQIIKQLDVKESGEENKTAAANKLQKTKTHSLQGMNTMMRE